MKNFALIGAAGYVAPRHIQAIRETGNRLVAAMDPSAVPASLQQSFPEVPFFHSFDDFSRFLQDFKNQGNSLDYVSVCSPNHLHEAHVRFGLSFGADVICEKPVVLTPQQVDALTEEEKRTGKRVYTILQLRMHPAAKALREKVMTSSPGTRYQVELTYIAPRDDEYYQGWKGDEQKSGGIVTNIGIHFFDLLQWIFGKAEQNKVTIYTARRAEGLLQLQKAEVHWLLSTEAGALPAAANAAGQKTYRAIRVDKEVFDISQGSADLHIRSYEAILLGSGISLVDTRPVISLVSDMRSYRNAE